MLLPDDIHPNNSIYFNGAFVLKKLQKQSVFSLLDLYQDVKKNKDMSFPTFILCLDWLFLLNIIELDNKGKIKICS